MSFKRFRWAVAAAAAALLVSPGWAAGDEEGGEVGIVVGAVFADENLSGDSGSADPTVGLRGGAVFAPHWGWFIDGLYSIIGTEGPLGDARTVAGRTGFEYMFTPEKDVRFFVSLGAGWMVVDYEDSAAADFHRPLAALGFGQRIRMGEKKQLRWEIRGDYTLDDARLDGEDVVQAHLLLGFSWGPGTADGGPRPGGRVETETASPGDDADGDGVRNKRDLCPNTPTGAFVDADGCPLDSDGDSVPDGLDRCPRTPRGEAVNTVGCPSDGDGDGVPDGSDVCGDTPTGARVDEWGCPKDSDGDRVPNGLDRCAATPWGAVVDEDGCPSDGDGDGVFDGIDRCPNTPAGTPIDDTGCPADSDGDGVHDGIDACPDTPSDVQVVDAKGCPRTPQVFEPDKPTVVLQGVNFEFNGANLTEDSKRILDRVARSLQESTGYRVQVSGHTDSAGDDSYNLSLSTRRAESVRDHLVARGVRLDRLIVRGYGESRPVGDNATEAGRAKNRRVELTKLD